MTLWVRLRHYGAVWGAASAILYILGNCSSYVVPLFMAGFVGLFLADLLLKMYYIFIYKRKTMKDVANKAVLITGCDSGFGNQLAWRLSKLGFRVYAACLAPHSAGAKELADNPRFCVIKMNVTKRDDISEAVKIVEKDLKEKDLHLWSVVNNAGVAASSEVEFQPLEVYRHLMEVNGLGPVAVTKAFLPLLRREGQGRVVNVISMAGRLTMGGFTAYCMSKHALVAFSDGLRVELKKWNISVHTIEPGLYKTPIVDLANTRVRLDQVWEAADEEVREAYGRTYYDAWVTALIKTLMDARPADKTYQVVDDMLDAVSGEEPQVRYIPATGMKMAQFLYHRLPVEIADHILSLYSTDALPAGRCRQDLPAGAR